jgi:hypothetical protein
MKAKIIASLSVSLLIAQVVHAASWSPLQREVFTSWENGDGYCQKLTIGGQKWRLPSASELVARHGSATPKAAWDTKGSGFDWVWSSTNRSPGEHFLVNVNNGAKSWPGDSRKAYVECISGASADPDAWFEEAQNAMQLQQWTRAINAAAPAANNGIPEATMMLAKFYFAGTGVAKDERKGFALYLKAANQGYALAQLSVAALYETGRGTAPDLAQALHWYKKAAAQGDQSSAGAVIRLQQ